MRKTVETDPEIIQLVKLTDNGSYNNCGPFSNSRS